MRHLDGPDLAVFQSVVADLRTNYTEEDLAEYHELAERIKAIQKRADDRQRIKLWD
jgi:hypothetical protein